MGADSYNAEHSTDKLNGIGRLGSERTELTMADTGQWLALSASSAHFFDLDAPSVTRIPGDGAVAFITDGGRTLRTIDVCRVGESGRWTMEPLPHQVDVEFAWHISTPIVKIVEVLGLEQALP